MPDANSETDIIKSHPLLWLLAGIVAIGSLLESLLQILGLSPWLTVIVFAVSGVFLSGYTIGFLNSKIDKALLLRPQSLSTKVLKLARIVVPATIPALIGLVIGLLIARGPQSTVHPRLVSMGEWETTAFLMSDILRTPNADDAEKESVIPSVACVIDFSNRGLVARSLTQVTLHLKIAAEDMVGSHYTFPIGYLVERDNGMVSNPIIDIEPGKTVREQIRFFFISVSAHDAKLPPTDPKFPRILRHQIRVVDSQGASRATSWDGFSGGRRFY